MIFGMQCLDLRFESCEQLFVQRDVPGVAIVGAVCMFGKLDKGGAMEVVDSCA